MKCGKYWLPTLISFTVLGCQSEKPDEENVTPVIEVKSDTDGQDREEGKKKEESVVAEAELPEKPLRLGAVTERYRGEAVDPLEVEQAERIAESGGPTHNVTGLATRSFFGFSLNDSYDNVIRKMDQRERYYSTLRAGPPDTEYRRIGRNGHDRGDAFRVGVDVSFYNNKLFILRYIVHRDHLAQLVEEFGPPHEYTVVTKYSGTELNEFVWRFGNVELKFAEEIGCGLFYISDIRLYNEYLSHFEEIWQKGPLPEEPMFPTRRVY